MAEQEGRKDLTLPESLLLLAADDETGRIDTGSGALGYGLAGAATMDLLLDGRLALIDGKVRLTGDAQTGDDALDYVAATIGASTPHDAKYWVRKLSGDQLKDRVLDELVERGVLKREEHRVLWVFPSNRYPAEDMTLEDDVRQKVRRVVIDGATPEPRTAALIGLLKSSNLTGQLFSRDERKQYGKRIDAIVNGDTIAAAVSKAFQEMQAAVMAAVIAATTATTTAASAATH